MTSAIFEEFLVLLDCPGGGAKTQKILLFMDQCVAHQRDTTALKNIKVIFLTPNCTSHLQPLDIGIIHTFKCQYSKQLIRKAVAVINEG